MVCSFRRNTLYFAAFAFLSFGCSLAKDVDVWLSPDHERRVVAKTIFGPNYTDYQVLKVFDSKQNLLASLSLEKGSGIDRAVVEDATWSPDSRFFVFETVSSGGHSIWHFPTYVYDTTTSLIYSIDDTLGATTAGNKKLRISPSNSIQLELYNSQMEKDSDPWSFKKTVLLPEFVRSGAKIAIHSIRYKP